MDDLHRSNFRTAAGKARYMAAYDATLALWTTPCRSLHVPTRWGRTHVVACGPEDAPPLVLLHGMSLSATMWFPNAAAWSREHRLYAVDTVGSAGKSIAARPLKNRADCAAWLEDVLDRLVIAQTDLLGHSYGGWLALDLALSAPQRVKRLVLLAPAASFQPLVPQFYLRGLPAIVFPRRSWITRFIRWMTVEGFVADERFVEQFVLGIQHCRVQIRAFPTVFSDDELQQIQVPTLLLVGEKEVIYDPQAAVRRARRWMPRVEGEVIAGASHGLPMERPALVNERVLHYLGRSYPVL